VQSYLQAGGWAGPQSQVLTRADWLVATGVIWRVARPGGWTQTGKTFTIVNERLRSAALTVLQDRIVTCLRSALTYTALFIVYCRLVVDEEWIL